MRRGSLLRSMPCGDAAVTVARIRVAERPGGQAERTEEVEKARSVEEEGSRRAACESRHHRRLRSTYLGHHRQSNTNSPGTRPVAHEARDPAARSTRRPWRIPTYGNPYLPTKVSESAGACCAARELVTAWTSDEDNSGGPANTALRLSPAPHQRPCSASSMCTPSISIHFEPLVRRRHSLATPAGIFM